MKWSYLSWNAKRRTRHNYVNNYRHFGFATDRSCYHAWTGTWAGPAVTPGLVLEPLLLSCLDWCWSRSCCHTWNGAWTGPAVTPGLVPEPVLLASLDWCLNRSWCHAWTGAWTGPAATPGLVLIKSEKHRKKEEEWTQLIIYAFRKGPLEEAVTAVEELLLQITSWSQWTKWPVWTLCITADDVCTCSYTLGRCFNSKDWLKINHVS